MRRRWSELRRHAGSGDPLRFNGASRRIWLLCVSGTLALAVRVPAAPPPDAAAGKALFQERCVACHTIGHGDRVGPDLAGVTRQRSVDWLTHWISTPDELLAQHDPVATQLLSQYHVPMPNFGLTAVQVADLIAYLSQPPPRKVAQAAAPPVTPAVALRPGTAAAGEALFLGTTRLQNGGPPCMACHSVAGIGALGGGTLGPDLTGAYGKLGQAVMSWPEIMPPMRAIYVAQRLTPQEKADLTVFLQGAPLARRAIPAMQRLALAAGLGAVGMLLAAQGLWWRRLRTVRRRLLGQVRAGRPPAPGALGMR